MLAIAVICLHSPALKEQDESFTVTKVDSGRFGVERAIGVYRLF